MQDVSRNKSRAIYFAQAKSRKMHHVSYYTNRISYMLYRMYSSPIKGRSQQVAMNRVSALDRSDGEAASKRGGLPRESAEQLVRRFEAWRPSQPLDPYGFDLFSGRDSDTAWIEISGEFDYARVPQVRDEIREAEGSDALRIVISLQNVTFIDCAALQLLIDAHRRMSGDPGRVRFLRSKHKPVSELIQVTQTEDVFY